MSLTQKVVHKYRLTSYLRQQEPKRSEWSSLTTSKEIIVMISLNAQNTLSFSFMYDGGLNLGPCSC